MIATNKNLLYLVLCIIFVFNFICCDDKNTNTGVAQVVVVSAFSSSSSSVLPLQKQRSIDTSKTFLSSSSSSSNNSNNNNNNKYRYFAYGSNVVLETMTSMRQINPNDFIEKPTAAILPNYRLRFNIPGIPKLEPSFASIEECTENESDSDSTSSSSSFPSSSSSVHGVLYTLNDNDFVKVGNTEGVPFTYRWKRCIVYPYVGNGNNAGYSNYMENSNSNAGSNNNCGGGLVAYTLVKNNNPMSLLPSLTPTTKKDNNDIDIPPSRAYLDLLLRGCTEYKFDKDYEDMLQSTPVSKNLLFGTKGIVASEGLKLSTWLSK